MAPPEDSIVVELVHQAVAKRAVADDHQSTALRCDKAPGPQQSLDVLFRRQSPHVEHDPLSTQALSNLLMPQRKGAWGRGAPAVGIHTIGNHS